jgi:hypothetical protein
MVTKRVKVDGTGTMGGGRGLYVDNCLISS